MITALDPKNAVVVGLPGEANTTTPANETSSQPYKPTNVVNAFCDWADSEVAAIAVDLKRMDSDGRGLLARGNSAFFGGMSMSVLSMVSGGLRSAPALIAHPIDTVRDSVRALPSLNKMGWEIMVAVDRDINLIREGRYAEGIARISKSGTDVGSFLFGTAGVVKGATSVFEKGTQLVSLGKREIVAAANAVREGMEGGGGALATASGVYMCAETAAAAAPISIAPMSGSGLISGPLLMSATDGAASGGRSADAARRQLARDIYHTADKGEMYSAADIAKVLDVPVEDVEAILGKGNCGPFASEAEFERRVMQATEWATHATPEELAASGIHKAPAANISIQEARARILDAVARHPEITTAQEIADHLGLPIKQVEAILDKTKVRVPPAPLTE